MHDLGSYVGSIYLQASTDGMVWDYLWWETGNQGDQWFGAEVSLAAYAGATVQLRFIGQTAHGWQGDLALDNVCVDDVLVPMPTVLLSEQDLADAIKEFQRTYEGDADLQADEFAAVELSIYPNPTKVSSILNVDIANISEDVTSVYMNICDLTGRHIDSRRLSAEYGVVNDFVSFAN